MHVGFDLDGVLLDSESDLAWLDRGLDSALDEIDVPATAEHRRRLYPGQVRNVEAVAADFGVDPTFSGRLAPAITPARRSPRFAPARSAYLRNDD